VLIIKLKILIIINNKCLTWPCPMERRLGSLWMNDLRFEPLNHNGVVETAVVPDGDMIKTAYRTVHK
jgi:hypothetical protein